MSHNQVSENPVSPSHGSENAEMAAAWDGPEGDHWVEHADRYEASSRRYREKLLRSLNLTSTSTVLDVGCGTGASTLDTGRVASAGSVLGVDLSSQMLARGRSLASAEGLDHVRFEQADAQVHPFEVEAFDVAISHFGAMFFSDPVAGFANIRRGLRPGGRLVLLAWRELARNEWITAVRTALAAGRDLPSPPPGAPGPSRLADQSIATAGLREAGFGKVDFVSVDEPIWFGADADDAYSFVSTFGITRGLTADLDPAVRAAALDQLRSSLKDHETSDGVQYGASAWLITASNHEETT